MISHPTSQAGFGVYMHWPFCAAKCPYCDFNSHVRQNGVDEARFLAAFRREMEHMAFLAPSRIVSSIFLGGGTPSLMTPETVAALIEYIGTCWTLDPDVEITLEANPTSVEADRFKGYRAAGVNRVSLGIQALEDEALKSLGRLHSVGEALKALDIAATTFSRFSFDLIYARAHQTLEEWQKELERGMAYAGGHLSLYQLTIEPDTPFEKLHKAGKLPMPSSEEGRHFYDLTQEICKAHGLPAYEISNHARPGEECRHNLLYWRYGEYAGIGPGAHGRLVTAEGRMASETEKLPERWLSHIEQNGHGVVERFFLTREEQGDEYLLMGLRLKEGIRPDIYERLAGRSLSRKQIDFLIDSGFLHETDGALAVTPEGFPVLDAVVADLAA
jgi:putative oxygen-independent coproporphyrinogen III oxidase